MTRPSTSFPPWAMVGEGWGRKAVDFATLSEPGNCREYVAMHHLLGVDAGDRLRAEINLVGYLARKPEAAGRA